MVKGRKRIKRSGRKVVKQKQRRYKKFIPPKFSSDTVKEKWDPAVNPTINLTSLGLSAHKDLNKVRKDPRSVSVPANKVDAVELFDVELVEGVKEKPFDVSVTEQRYIAKLMKRHGLDYKKMFWDKKLNFMQRTEEYLKRLSNQFLALEDDQRKVEIPMNISSDAMLCS